MKSFDFKAIKLLSSYFAASFHTSTTEENFIALPIARNV